MNKKDKKSFSEDEFEAIQEKAEQRFGDFLDFLDEIPNPPKRAEIPFPYGSDQARPYGWYSD